jgi:hypothetical protein
MPEDYTLPEDGKMPKARYVRAHETLWNLDAAATEAHACWHQLHAHQLITARRWFDVMWQFAAKKNCFHTSSQNTF